MTPARRADRGSAGYVLLAVLLLSALIASLVMTYSRHALLAADSSAANLAVQQAQHAADSGFAWAKQSLLADAGSTTRLDLGDGRSVAVAVGDEAGRLRSVAVDASTAGASQSLQATFEMYPTAGDELPELSEAAKAVVNAATAKITINSTASYSNTELNGVLLLRTGADVTLQDVVLNGCIVSASALTGNLGSVHIRLRGGVLIDPAGVLAGNAIMAPDAELSGDGSERIQIMGAVVADSIELPGRGAIHGPVASAEAAELGGSIDRPGAGRGPQDWPSSLLTGASAVGRMAFSAVDVRTAERDAIRGFTFPARTGSP